MAKKKKKKKNKKKDKKKKKKRKQCDIYVTVCQHKWRFDPYKVFQKNQKGRARRVQNPEFIVHFLILCHRKKSKKLVLTSFVPPCATENGPSGTAISQ